MVKKQLAKLAVRSQLRRMIGHPNPFNRIWGRAALLQFGAISDEDFRRDLDQFYAGLDPESCKQEIDLRGKAELLERTHGYKTDVLSLQSDRARTDETSRLDLWRRRFGLLRHLGIRSDVLVVRADGQISPHGHSQVVSGFYVLEGQVAIRHYDRVSESADHVMLRKVVDAVIGPGAYTTNSEYHHNIHWLLGLAPLTYLFRFTVTDVPVHRFNAPAHSHTRDYVDPTVPPDASGLIPAPYIAEVDAKQIKFIRELEQV